MLGSGEKGSRTDHEASGEGWGFIPGMLGSHWKALSMAAFQLAATFKSPSDGCVQPGSIGVSDTSSRAGEMVAGTLVREAVGLTRSVRGGNSLDIPSLWNRCSRSPLKTNLLSQVHVPRISSSRGGVPRWPCSVCLCMAPAPLVPWAVEHAAEEPEPWSQILVQAKPPLAHL